MALDDLGSLVPEIQLNTSILSHPRQKALFEVEVAFPDYWAKLSAILRTSNQEMLRAYFLWQAFLQSEELWYLDWVKPWREFKKKLDPIQHVSHASSGGQQKSRSNTAEQMPDPTMEQNCRKKLQRQFGLLLDSYYVRPHYASMDKLDLVASRELFRNLARAFETAVDNTSWIDEGVRDLCTSKLRKMNISVGYSAEASSP